MNSPSENRPLRFSLAAATSLYIKIELGKKYDRFVAGGIFAMDAEGAAYVHARRPFKPIQTRILDP